MMKENVQAQVRNLTIEELVEEIGSLKWEKGIEFCKITEKFISKGKKSYIVRGLEADLDMDDDVICCTDLDNILSANMHLLSTFLTNNITAYKVDSTTFMIKFLNETTITIEGIQW